MRKKMFWLGIGLLIVEVALFIFMMKLASPLKDILPLYALLVVVLGALSVFLVRKGKNEKSDTKVLLFGLTAGMLWWTITEINAEAFMGSGIEDQAGFWLLFVAILVLSTIWKDINKTSKVAISSFMFNWCSHMVLKIIMHFRNPTAVEPAVWTGSVWNVFNVIGFAYGIFSIIAIIYIASRAIRKGFTESKLHYYVLAMYVAILNLLYIFIKGYFLIW